MAERQLGRSLTPDQLSEQLDGLASPNTLRRWAKQGKIPGAFRVGNKYFFARNTAAWLIKDLSAWGGGGKPIGTVPKDGSDTNGTVTPSSAEIRNAREQ